RIEHPVVAGDLAIVIVVFPIPLAPCVEFTGSYAKPFKYPPLIKLPLVPVVDKVHHLVTEVRLHPASLQSSPRFFFKVRCSSMSSESTESLRWSFFLSSKISARSFASARFSSDSNAFTPFSKKSACHW